MNWGELISSNLDNKLKKVHKENQFYMSTYLMNVMCASLEFPTLSWKWESSLPSIHVYCKMLWEKKYKEDYEMICKKLFLTLYQVLFGEEAPCLSPEGKEIVKEYGDCWLLSRLDPSFVILRSNKPLDHWPFRQQGAKKPAI